MNSLTDSAFIVHLLLFVALKLVSGLIIHSLLRKKVTLPNGKVLSQWRWSMPATARLRSKLPGPVAARRYPAWQIRLFRQLYVIQAVSTGLLLFIGGLLIMTMTVRGVQDDTALLSSDPVIMVCAITGVALMAAGVLHVYFRDAGNPFVNPSSR